MFKYLKVINQANTLSSTPHNHMAGWDSGTWSLSCEGRTAEQGRPSPSPSPALPTSGSHPLLCPEESAACKSITASEVQAQAILFRPHKQLYLDYLSGWDMGPGGRPALALGAGVLGKSRCSEHSLEGAGLQVATPLVLSLAACTWRRVQPPDEPSRASKNQCFSNCTVSSDSPGIWRFLSVGLG